VKKVEKHWFMICKQQHKIEAKYSRATNAGNVEKKLKLKIGVQ